MLDALLGTGAIVAILLLGFYLARYPIRGWYLLLTLDAANYFISLNQFAAGPIHLSSIDVVFFALLIAGVLRFRRIAHEPSTMRILGLLFTAVFLFTFLRGALIYGFIAASNESRGYVSYVLGMTIFQTFPTDYASVRKVVRALLYYGGALVLAAILHWGGLNMGSFSDEDEKGRVLPAAATAEIAVCFFLSLGWISHRRSSQLLRWLPAVFSGMAVMLQHRTVWNVLLVGALALLVTDFGMIKRFAPTAVLTGLVTLGLAIGVYGSSEQVSNEFQDSATNSGTWQWRVNGWRSLIFESDTTPFTVIFGRPMAEPMIRYDGSFGWQTVGPHSAYVEVYVRFGILGEILLVIFLLRPLALLHARHSRNRLSMFPSPSSWMLVVLAAIVYGVTYGEVATVFGMVGYANAMLLRPVSEEVREDEETASENDAASIIPLGSTALEQS